MSQAQTFDFRHAIERAIAEFESAARAKDAAGMAALYSEDATLLPPGSPLVKGRSNIQNFWRAFLDAGAADPKLQILSVESSDDLAYEIGSWEAIVPNPGTGKAGPAAGNYLVVWKRQSDGRVKMVADMFH